MKYVIFRYPEPSKAHRSLPPLPGMPMFLLRMVGQQNAHRHPTNQTASQRSNCAGKHPPWKEVEALGMKDLEAVSAFLGDKVSIVSDLSDNQRKAKSAYH